MIRMLVDTLRVRQLPERFQECRAAVGAGTCQRHRIRRSIRMKGRLFSRPFISLPAWSALRLFLASKPTMARMVASIIFAIHVSVGVAAAGEGARI